MPNNKPIYALSLHKAGSTLLFKGLTYICERSSELNIDPQYRYISIPDKLFADGVPELELESKEPHVFANASLDENEVVYGGFRFCPGFITQEFLKNSGLMILVRDPRDMLTSLYFSVLKSHSIPKKGKGNDAMKSFRKQVSTVSIDDFVIQQAEHGPWVARFDRLLEIRDMSIWWRYEDVVFNKHDWVDEILEFVGINLPDNERELWVERENIIPDRERPDEHIRQVSPGNYKKKLQPETIIKLNIIFKKQLADWGYD